MASVTPRATKSGPPSWRVQYRIAGRMKERSFLTEKAARDYGRLVDRVGGEAAEQVLDARDRDDATVPTLRDWTVAWLDPDSGLLGGVTPGTRHGYQVIAERSFLPMLGDLPLDAISRTDVGRWVAWQERQPSIARPDQAVSAKTVRNYHAVLSSLFRAAVEAGHITVNPARGVKLAAGLREEMVLLTEQQLEAIVAGMPEHYRPLTLFLAGTGMRWGEATALTWSDLDLAVDPPTVRVTKAWKRGPGGNPVLGPPKTRKSIRTISLWPELVARLGEPGPPDQLIFRGRQDGRRLWSERFHKSAWDPAVEAAALPRRPRVHDLRHAHASWLIAAGAPLPYVQARLGHEKITTTVDTYGHLMPDAHVQLANAAAARMTGLLGAPVKGLEALS